MVMYKFPLKYSVVYEGDETLMDFMLDVMMELHIGDMFLVRVDGGENDPQRFKTVERINSDAYLSHAFRNYRHLEPCDKHQLHDECICHVYSPLPVLYLKGGFLPIASLKPKEVANIIRDVYEEKCNV